jgi:hypothetical protein
MRPPVYDGRAGDPAAEVPSNEVGLAILDSLADFEAEIPRLHGSERSSDVLVVPARQPRHAELRCLARA